MEHQLLQSCLVAALNEFLHQIMSAKLVKQNSLAMAMPSQETI